MALKLPACRDGGSRGAAARSSPMQGMGCPLSKGAHPCSAAAALEWRSEAGFMGNILAGGRNCVFERPLPRRSVAWLMLTGACRGMEGRSSERVLISSIIKDPSSLPALDAKPEFFSVRASVMKIDPDQTPFFYTADAATGKKVLLPASHAGASNFIPSLRFQCYQR